MDDVLIPLSALNAYMYCPRRCYYEYVLNEYTDNFHTIKGKVLHEVVDNAGDNLKEGILKHKSIYLASYKLGIKGICDLIEENNEDIYPVEYKKGKKGKWLNDMIQLCAQGLLLQECIDKQVDYGYIYYIASNRRYKIIFSEEIKGLTAKCISDVKDLFNKELPHILDNAKKCIDCSINRICMPLELRKLKEGGKSAGTIC